eukprot:CAMPEP_0180511348 /NCGR_PEP_ID=MMETSP1036_2-20121128/50934_1 /TAXON_ID=632150 /ORGANISM="Azadinium spinosum, Strain 3D9" /LENGTH=69 /DNA_ID=CAMNT_0022522269 /DNA_START=223 /DNA_END=432 /DNA_ORIENTATION=-
MPAAKALLSSAKPSRPPKAYSPIRVERAQLRPSWESLTSSASSAPEASMGKEAVTSKGREVSTQLLPGA